MKMHEEFFHHEKYKTSEKQRERYQAVMVFFITMIKGVGTDTKSQPDHTPFEEDIINDIDAKQRQTAEKQGQQGTMNGTGQRGPNS